VEFRPVVGLNHVRQPAFDAKPLQYPGDARAGQRDVDFDGEALATPFVEHGKGPKPAPVEQAVVNEIDRPRLVCRQRPRAHNAQMTQPFAPPPSLQRQSFLAIQALDALVIGLPALAAQHQIEQRGQPQRRRSSANSRSRCRNKRLRSSPGARRKARRVIPISPQARRCDILCVVITCATI
jgi:hypothetical protein